MVAHKTLAKLLKIPYAPFQNGVPMILPSSGSMGNNGAITLTTALPATYANCYLYLPANAIQAGSAAGLYYAVMSSATVGTVYNNIYTSGAPTIPSSPSAFATTGPGAYTQTTGSDITLFLNTMPGGSIGANGSLFCFPLWACNNSVNTKTLKQKINATETNSVGIGAFAINATPFVFRNRGVTNKNVSNASTGLGSHTTSPIDSSIDTSSDATVELTGRLANAADYLVLSGVTYQINP